MPITRRFNGKDYLEDFEELIGADPGNLAVADYFSEELLSTKETRLEPHLSEPNAKRTLWSKVASFFKFIKKKNSEFLQI